MNLGHFSSISFPVYRKYKNEKSWFRITGPDSFEEIRIIGSRFDKSSHQVKTLPERNFILDLVFHYHEFAQEITAADYSRIDAMLSH